MKRLWKLGMAIMIMVVCMLRPGQICLAVGNEYDTAIEADYGEKFNFVNNNHLAGSPLEANPANGVDTASGDLILSRTDLSLAGTGGMDFKLDRYYNSNEANIGHPTVEAVEKLEVENIRIQFTAQDGSTHQIAVNTAILKNHKQALDDLLVTYEETKNKTTHAVKNSQRTKIVSSQPYNAYGISCGWRFDFPWIETVTIKEDSGNGWGEIPAYLHMGSIGTMEIETSANSSTKSYSITGLSGYNYSDVKLEDCDRMVDGVPCRYLLRDKKGLRTFFNADGMVAIQKDAHGNSIRFVYEDKIYFSKIIDSVGREILFHYGSASNGQKVLNSVTVEGQKTVGGVSKKVINYQTKERSYTPLNSKKLYGLTLESVTVDGVKEKYSYKTMERLVNTSGAGIASQRAATNQTYLLNKVSMGDGEKHYKYRACSRRGPTCESGAEDRDVVVEGFYVTREFSRDTKTGKKSSGMKYDYFQKHGDTLVSYADFQEGKDELWQYGRSGLRTVTVISSFNPNKYKENGKYYDYKYQKSQINTKTLRLKNNTKKNVGLYIYNENKMPEEEVNYGKIRQENLYSYDNDGKGTLVVLETECKVGTKATNISKVGYTYDAFRNITTETTPQAFQEKNQRKKYLYVTDYTYFKTDQNYPANVLEPYNYTLCKSTETYSDANSVLKKESVLASNGVDIDSTTGSVKKGTDGYEDINQIKYNYDKNGNMVKEILYPNYDTGGTGESITRTYAFNPLGQQTGVAVAIRSEKDSSQNKSYTMEESTYDAFGNLLSKTDMDGNTTEYKYDEETGMAVSEVGNAGTETETLNEKYVSDDMLKEMTIDEFGMCVVQIMDVFGNVIIEKNEKMGTWVESLYDYGNLKEDVGDDDTGDDDDENDEGDIGENEGLLIEERVYSFVPDEEKFLTDENGEQIANYDIGGRSDTLLSSHYYTYNEYGECIVEAEFTGETMDAESCVSWQLHRSTEDTEEGCTVQTDYEKMLDPTKYVSDCDKTNYYTEYDSYVLSENISETKNNDFGNVVEMTNTTKQDGQELHTVTTNTYDDMERNIMEETVTTKKKDGKEETGTESISYELDYIGRIVETKTSQTVGDSQTETYTEKMEYDNQGRMLSHSDTKGSQEGYAIQYKYDLAGNITEMDIPMDEENGKITYNTMKNEYSEDGKLKAVETVREDGENSRKEYSYDTEGNLVMVKECLDGGKAQYTQYLYDTQGNQIRQYTGMTKPLTISFRETEDTDAEYSYINKKYKIEVSGGNEKDTICEYSYAYDQKDQIISCKDPEGRVENYQYDEYGNNTKMTDKKGNLLDIQYDRWGQVVKETATDAETEDVFSHIYRYDLFGNVIYADGTTYEYDDITGGVTRECRNVDGLGIEKIYSYDGEGREKAFCLKVKNKTVMDYTYQYDSMGCLTAVGFKDGSGERKTVAEYTYDENDNLVKTLIPDIEMLTEYTYDLNDSVTGISASQGKRYAKELADFQIEYLQNGQIKSEKGSMTGLDENGKKGAARKVINNTYKYDRLGRLIQETDQDGDGIEYTYDANNNRSQMIYQNKVTDYHYNKNGELLRSDTLNNGTKDVDTVIYKNDKNGNQLAAVNRKKTETDKEYFDLNITLGDNRFNDNIVYHYNAMDQLTNVLTGNTKVEYSYNADGLREQKKINGKSTIYIWDGDQLALELDESGKVKRRYIRGNDLIFYDKGEDTERFYYVTDVHGDVVQLVNENGTVAKTYEYDAFGNEKNMNKKDENPFRYGGEYFDVETETLFLRERNYSPKSGRFLTRDSYTGEDDEPLSLNGYTFCENDPVSQMDYNGNWPNPVKAVKKAKKKVKSWTKKQLNKADKALQKISHNVKNSKVYKTSVHVSTIMARLGLFDKNLFKLGGFEKYLDLRTRRIVYYTKRKCIQQYFGYNEFYDYVFDLATDMNANKVEFSNHKFVLWMWKGDYLNLGAGGEVGIYKKLKGGLWYVNKWYSLYMTMQLYFKGKLLYDRRPILPQWWITGFVPSVHNVKQRNLRLEGSVSFLTLPTIKLWKSFEKESKIKDKKSDPRIWQDRIKVWKTGIATFSWK